jgi:hypothetical protein
MPKVKSFKGQGGLGIGQGPCAAQPTRIVPPTHTSPDVVDVSDQKNKGQALKMGLSSSKPVHHNPGRKP